MQHTELARVLSRNAVNGSVVRADGDDTGMIGYRSDLDHQLVQRETLDATVPSHPPFDQKSARSSNLYCPI